MEGAQIAIWTWLGRECALQVVGWKRESGFIMLRPAPVQSAHAETAAGPGCDCQCDTQALSKQQCAGVCLMVHGQLLIETKNWNEGCVHRSRFPHCPDSFPGRRRSSMQKQQVPKQEPRSQARAFVVVALRGSHAISIIGRWKVVSHRTCVLCVHFCSVSLLPSGLNRQQAGLDHLAR